MHFKHVCWKGFHNLVEKTKTIPLHIKSAGFYKKLYNRKHEFIR